MSSTHEPAAPAWVKKRDLRVVPFEADKIAHGLFAASEECGRPDAFLARELADGVVHFLAGEADSTMPTTEQVAEVVVKVVRELGHPRLAEAFAEFARGRSRQGRNGGDRPGRPTRGTVQFSLREPLAAVQEDCLRQYTLQTVFSRDLAAAHRDGLLTLLGLEAPGELASCLLLAPPTPAALLTLLEAGSRRAGDWLVLDGPEHALLPGEGQDSGPRLAEEWTRQLLLGLRLTGRRAVLNLNVSQPPPWADELAAGPLFAGQRRVSGQDNLAALADALLETVVGLADPSMVRVDWHLAERDFTPQGRDRLLSVARLALLGAPLTFAFDRPRRPLALAEGIDRRRPAVLLVVGLNLPRLATLVSEEGGDPTARQERLLGRLRSLARLAMSAAVQKREYLRQARGRSWTTGFLLERARLLVAPLGLDHTVEQLCEQRLSAGRQGLEMGEQLLTRLREVLAQEGRQTGLEACVDTIPNGRADEDVTISGPTCWGPDAPVRSQLRAIGKLQASAGGGTGLAVLPAEPMATAEQLAEWLAWAWRQTDTLRLSWLRQPTAHRQLTFPSAETGR